MPSMPSFQQVSHTSDCDSVSLPASLFDLERLFDPYSTPTIYLGSLGVPGPLLPLTIAVVFVCYKVWQYQARRDRGIQIGIEQLPPTPRQNSLEWPGLNHPDALRTYVAKTNLVFHGIITHGAIVNFGRSFLGNDALCCVEVVALLVYAEIVKPEMRRSCLAAALGWVVFMVLDRMEGDVAALVMGLVVVLAAPMAWQVDGVRGEMELQQSLSGLLLMLMVANRVLFDSKVAMQQWVEESPMRAGKYLATLYVGNGLMMWAFNSNKETSIWDTRWDLQRMLTALKQWMSVAFNSSILAAAFLGVFVGGIVSTAYLASCLPWSRFFFGVCASSPSLSLFSLAAGAAVYSNMFLFGELIHLQRGRGRANRAPAAFVWAQIETGANLIGWACLFMNSLYVAIEILL
jgi:hypothetical protein